MINLSGDLHCHTTISDGSMKPDRIVELAAQMEIHCIAVTDHDAMDGIETAQNRGAEVGVHVLAGLEVSTYDYLHGKKVHLLCLLPKKPSVLLELCRETLKRRHAATLEMIARMRRHYPIDVQTVRRYAPQTKALCKQHIMLALVDMGYSLSVFGELYKTLFAPKTGWALVETHLPDTRDAIRLIKETGGAAILAHPGVYGNFDIIEELCRLSLDGIEVFHSRQSEKDTARARAAADRFGLIRTGGSDFHGMISSRINPLGSKQTEDGELAKLLERFG